MAATVGSNQQQRDHGHTGAVDEALAREHGGKPATWHSRRFGPHAVNDFTFEAMSVRRELNWA